MRSARVQSGVHLRLEKIAGFGSGGLEIVDHDERSSHKVRRDFAHLRSKSPDRIHVDGFGQVRILEKGQTRAGVAVEMIVAPGLPRGRFGGGAADSTPPIARA